MSRQAVQPLVLSALVTGLLTLVGVGGHAAEGEKVIQRLVSWPSDDGPSPSGLVLMYLTSDGLEELLLFHGSDGSRLLLTSKVEPSQGRIVHTLQDDETGWWIQLGTKVEVTGETLQEFYQKAYAEDELLHELWLETTGGPQVRVSGAAHGGPSASQVVLRELERQEGLAQLAHSVPRPSRHWILFLANSLANVGGALEPGVISGRREDPLLELLASVLTHEEGQAGLSVTPMVLEEIRKGAEAPFARRDELLERFERLPPKAKALAATAP